MTRNISVQAVILAHRRSEGQHRRAVLLSPSLGLIEATAYGAKRGSLTGKIGQFTSGICELYRNPARNTCKIVDFSPEEYRPYITSSLPVMYTASMISECIMRTFVGGGEYEELYHLTSAALDALADESCRERVVIQFLWRYLLISGFMADVSHCASCGKPAEQRETLFLNRQDTALTCSRCADSQEQMLLPGARAYLAYTVSLSFSRALQVQLSSDAVKTLKNLLIAYIDQITEGTLRTIGSGMI